ncbi:excinuclease ABC subunit UvrC [Algicola sagamiensis]|uniref:excinuclease ABC subunit UvrC n=1 Tax=Algicola sagamiensis TaxID=163869 RepID=UPI00036ED7CF|nr:excinuclease ABC subunit UvrC [Algicola sagamiensis]
MTNQPFDSKNFLKHLTSEPGVYRMYDSQETVIYVGKAKDLKKRLSSYFRKNIDNGKTRTLVKQICQIEITVTHTEAEALILESHLIKKYKPRYNVLLRDDKSYPYILVTDHRHPRISFHRGAKKEKGDYFGPYPSGGAVHETLRLMQKVFPVRQCEDAYYRARSRPCLQYQLKRCSAPCVNKVTDEAYQHQVALVRLFLSGKSETIVEDLIQSMEAASLGLRFEEAALYRDQIAMIRKITQQQYVTGQSQELDIIGFHYENGIASVHVLFIRDHKVLGSRNYFPKVPNFSQSEEVFQSFLLQFYLSGNRQIPKEIVLSHSLHDSHVLQDAIQQTSGKKVKMTLKPRGEKAKFRDLAERNATTAFQARQLDKSHISARYQALKELLDLDDIQRMECFDISHTMGEQTVASCVVFQSDGPCKNEYRRFNVTGITPGDDYAAMAFALKKRYGKIAESQKIPDVIFIDGGQGQLAQAESFFAQWPHDKTPILVGVAKGTSRKPGLETLLFHGGTQTIALSRDNLALLLIQHIRDESHRFAIAGHRSQRGKATRKSQLENIEGIGPKRRQALLKYFGGLQGVQAASIEELAKVPGISKAQAQVIYETLQN